MATAFAFLGTLLLSAVVATLAALQLGDFFGSGDELQMVIGTIAGYTTLTILIFAVSFRLAERASLLDAVAFLLAMLVVALALWPGILQRIAERSTNPYTVGTEKTFFSLELLIPGLLAVLIQWGLVRQRWLQAAGEDEMPQWPWLTTMAAVVLILNPFGLALLWSATHSGPGALMSDLAATVAAAAVCVLVVMGLVECYIRRRIHRRRLQR